MPKRKSKERDPELWAMAKLAFDKVNPGCYSPQHTEEAKIEEYYKKLLRLRTKSPAKAERA